MRGHWKIITLKTEGYDWQVKVLVVAPGLAVDGHGRRWAITHIPSGRMLGFKNGPRAFFTTRRQAIAVAERLAELTDWSALMPTNFPEGLQEQLRAILEEG